MRTRGARPTTPGWLGMADVRTSVLWRRIQPPRATPRSTDRRPPWSSCRARAATEQLLSWAIGRGSDSKARLPLLTPVFLLPVQFVSSLLTKLGSCARRGSLVRTTRATGDLSPFARCAQAGRVAITARGQTGGCGESPPQRDRPARSLVNPRTTCDRTKSATTSSSSMFSVEDGALNNENSIRVTDDELEELRARRAIGATALNA